MSGLSGPNDRIHKYSPPWSPSPLHASPQEAPDLCIDPLTFTYHGSPHFLPGPTFTTGCIGEFVLEALSCKQRRLSRVVSRCSRYFAARMSAGAA